MNLGKFTSGYTYLIKHDSSRWYMVKQTGQRTWEAFMFSHVVDLREDYIPITLKGNSIALANEFNKLGVTEVFSSDNTIEVRKAMFVILSKGTLEGLEL